MSGTWLSSCRHWSDSYKQCAFHSKCPTLNCDTFKLREREVGKAVVGTAKSSCQDFLNMETKEALHNGVQVDESNLVPIPCSFDMGWQKRGKGHNSHTGQAAVMSLSSGKVLASVVQRPDNFILWLSHYPTVSICAKISVFPLVQANMHTLTTVKFGSVQKP